MKIRVAACLIAIVASLVAVAACRPAPMGPRLVVVGPAGIKATLAVTFADTQAARERGLMGREQLGPEEGMLFVFERPDFTPFWMKDTPIPLAIAFIAASGEIVGLDEMAPMTTDFHTGPAPYQFALEASGGYFERHGVRVGDKVQLLEPDGTRRELEKSGS